MSDFEKHSPDELLERYLDGTLTGEQLEVFQAGVQEDPELAQVVSQDWAVVERLRQNLEPSIPSVEAIEQLLGGHSAVSIADARERSPLLEVERSISRRRMVGAIVGSGLAAAAAWILVTLQFGGSDDVAPYFQQRPLASLYRESVTQGFRPYYYCEDQERFARTFLKRQATPLVLAELPQDRRMVGLSYPGGLSRDTTAMLAYVQEKPVIVFVDRLSVDNPALAATSAEDAGLFVHRSLLGDLVMYEVTPLETPQMIRYLQVANASAGG